MSLTHDLHKGMVIRHQGELFTVLDYRVAQTGKMRPTVHVKLRSIRSGHPNEKTLDELGKLEEVAAETRPMQYLYTGGEEWVFMDTESFEQCPIGADMLGDYLDLLVEQETYRFLMVEGQPVSIQFPSAVVLEVVDTAPVEHAGGSTNVQKEAQLSSGAVVQVPLFIKTGDKIRVKTDTREYQGKEH